MLNDVGGCLCFERRWRPIGRCIDSLHHHKIGRPFIENHKRRGAGARAGSFRALLHINAELSGGKGICRQMEEVEKGRRRERKGEQSGGWDNSTSTLHEVPSNSSAEVALIFPDKVLYRRRRYPPGYRRRSTRCRCVVLASAASRDTSAGTGPRSRICPLPRRS